MILRMRARIVHIPGGRLFRGKENFFSGPGPFRTGSRADHYIVRKQLAVNRDILLKIIVPRNGQDVGVGYDRNSIVQLWRPVSISRVVGPGTNPRPSALGFAR